MTAAEISAGWVSAETFLVSIVDLFGKDLSMQCTSITTVFEVKEFISEQLGFECDEQRILHEETILNDETLLGSCQFSGVLLLTLVCQLDKDLQRAIEDLNSKSGSGQMNACMEFANRCLLGGSERTCERRRVVAVKAGAIQGVVGALDSVPVKAGAALKQLCKAATGLGPERLEAARTRRMFAAESGAIDALCKIILAPFSEATENACAALLSICRETDLPQDSTTQACVENHRKRAVELGVLPGLVSLLSRPLNLPTRHVALSLLQKLASTGERRSLAIAAGADARWISIWDQ
jgi:hypothetical protein